MLGAMSTAPPVMGVWVRPAPGVVKVAPRVFWKVVNGVTAGVPLVAPPPSQLISRWPVAEGPPLPLSGLPSAARNASTVDWISAGFAPEAVNSMGEATTGAAHARA